MRTADGRATFVQHATADSGVRRYMPVEPVLPNMVFYLPFCM